MMWVLSFLCITLCNSAFADPVIRFWVGYAQNRGEGYSRFVSKLNETLVPETVYIGAGQGLLAYTPVVLDNEIQSVQTPDELALIIYASPEAYQTIRQSPRGAAYGPLHYSDGLFAKEITVGDRKVTSGSTIAHPLDDRAAGDLPVEERTWVLGTLPADLSDLQTTTTWFRTIDRQINPPADLSDVDAYLRKFHNIILELNVAASIVRLHEGRLYQYLFFSPQYDVPAKDFFGRTREGLRYVDGRANFTGGLPFELRRASVAPDAGAFPHRSPSPALEIQNGLNFQFSVR